MDVALRPFGHQLPPLGIAFEIADDVDAFGDNPQSVGADILQRCPGQLPGDALPFVAGRNPGVGDVQRVARAFVVDDGLLVAQVERVALPCGVVSKRISVHGAVFGYL